MKTKREGSGITDVSDVRKTATAVLTAKLYKRLIVDFDDHGEMSTDQIDAGANMCRVIFC